MNTSQLEVTIAQIFSSWVTFTLLVIVGFAVVYFGSKKGKKTSTGKKSRKSK